MPASSRSAGHRSEGLRSMPFRGHRRYDGGHTGSYPGGGSLPSDRLGCKSEIDQARTDEGGKHQVGNAGSQGQVDNHWLISTEARVSAARVAPAATASLLWRPAAKGKGSLWVIAGEHPSLTFDQRNLAGPLPAGWYELHGWLGVEEGSIQLPSVRLHYVRHSALTMLEVMLPDVSSSRRIRVLLLFLEDVESFEFLPGVAAARFRMRDFVLRRVTRTRALWLMLRGPVGVRLDRLFARTLAWSRGAVSRGPRRAADELYSDYLKRSSPTRLDEYARWARKYDSLGPVKLEAFRQRARTLADRGPLISVLLHLDDGPEAGLRRCIDSVLGQVWERWELCVSHGPALGAPAADMLAEYAAGDARIRIQHAARDIDASNTTLAMARGEFIALLEPCGELRPHALLHVAESAMADPETAIVYADEDRLADDGTRFDHHFKPGWNPDLLRSTNYMGHFVAIRTMLVHAAGGFRGGFGSCRDYDLVLRCSERLAPRQVQRIPVILYHQRAEDGTASTHGNGPETPAAACVRVVAEHLGRMGSAARVEMLAGEPGHRIRWPLPRPVPKVSLIVPTRDRVDLLRMCVESVLTRSTYADFEVVVVDNQSSERATLSYLDELTSHERVRVLHYDAPFNYSAINNWAAGQCNGQVLGLINNDIEVISPGWLEEMVGLAVRPDTGAVGAMLYYPDDTIQHAGMLLGLFGVAGHVYAGQPRGHRGYHGRARRVQNLSAVTGACLLVRRAVFEEAGGLDEAFPVEFNDIDFCLRLCQRGYRNVWTPYAELYHHESASRVVDGAAMRRMRSGEIETMLARWGDRLKDDVAYNPNLSLQGRNFELAFPPRASA